MYLIIEVVDRDLTDICTAPDYKTAVDIANRLLREHCARIGKENDYDAYAGLNPPDDWPPDLQLCDAGSGSMNAWCNLNDIHFDVHIRKLPEEV